MLFLMLMRLKIKNLKIITCKNFLKIRIATTYKLRYAHKTVSEDVNIHALKIVYITSINQKRMHVFLL